MIISVQLAFNSELNIVFRNHKLLYSKQYNIDAEFNILATFLMHEKIKKHSSFFQPYIDLVE